MKKVLLSVMMIVSVLVVSPDINAQGMRSGRDGNHRIENSNSGRRNSGGSERQSFRPGKENGNHNGNKPGGNQSVNRPGSGNQSWNNGNHNGNNNGNHNGNRPNPNYRPGNGGNNGYRPGPVANIRPGANRPAVMHRPYRPGLAPVRPFSRPIPPPTWRPSGIRVNLWSNILGITVGMTINNAIDRLLYDGYAIAGYNGNEIYLTDVPMYDCYWPDATMYYNGGQLMGSRFFYSTLGYDPYRYNDLFNRFSYLYGQPVSYQRTSSGMSATWYGSNNQFITLDFGPQLTDAGRRYFTTLSIGM